jgi:dipeptidyl aminopeptidase/acylaminoacyl peptidase
MSAHTRIAVTAVACLLWAGGAAAEKRPITHEDVWRAARLGTPVVSPDGTAAVIQVTEPAYEEREQTSDLWIVPTDGSAPPRRLTATRTPESGAAWSADSRRVAFSARRDLDEAPQIYVIDVAEGGEARRVTRVSTGARSPVWRPDGQAILFVSDVYPGARTDEENKRAAEERRNRKWQARVYDSFPIRDWDRWLDDRRPSLLLQRLEPDTEARDLLAGSELTAGAGFAGQWGSGSDAIAAVWTPDGSGVVFAATANRHEAAFATVDQSLWLVPVDGGEPRRLTTGTGSYARPVFSDDGSALFAAFTPETDRVYNATRLVRWGWPLTAVPGGAALQNPPDVITSGFDRSVGSFAPSPDGRTAYLLAEDQGRQKLYAAVASGDPVREVGTLAEGTIGALAVGGHTAPVLLGTWESAVSPAEIVRLDAGTGQRTRLSSFNTERAAAIDWQPLREFWFTSSRGARIHSFLALPPGFNPNGKYPLFVLMHGGPHTMWTDHFFIRWNYHLLAQPGYVVLLTNYTGSTGYGEAFAQGIQGDPLEGPALEINEAADEAVRRFAFIDGSRQAAGGASYGGHLANWMAVSTSRYKALISHAGLFDQAQQWGTSDTIWGRERNAGGPPWEGGPVWTKQNPLLLGGNLETPMLVTVGERDYRVPMNNAIQLWSALQRMRVPSRFIVFPEENHWVMGGENSRFFYAELHAWLARWLDADTPGESPGRSTAVKAAISDVAWLAGEWVGTRGPSSIGERWTEPAGGAMLALSRTVTGDRLAAFEFLRIVERDGTLVYVAQPDGRPPTEFVLTGLSRLSATFENPDHDYPQVIRYTRQADGTLEARISGRGGERTNTFVFSRR